MDQYLIEEEIEHDDEPEEEMTHEEWVLDRAECYTQLIDSTREILSETQYILDHPDEYDDFVVEHSRFRLPGYKEELAHWRARRQELCREYPGIVPKSFDDRVS